MPFRFNTLRNVDRCQRHGTEGNSTHQGKNCRTGKTLGILVIIGIFDLVAKQDFATANELFIDPQPIFIGAGFGAGAGRTGLQAHSNRGLKYIRTKRATVYVEFDAQIAGIANPGYLITRVENYGFRKNTNENGAFGHGESLQLTLES